MNIKSLYWAAGFIDGEGCFCENGRTISIRAVQVDKWHIDKLHKLFGGYMNIFSRKEVKSKGGVYHVWTAYGHRAAGIMMTLYSLLSPRRKQRVKELLKAWLKKPMRSIRGGWSAYCIHGHLLKDNIFISSKGARGCRKCAYERNRRYRERKKQSVTLTNKKEI